MLETWDTTQNAQNRDSEGQIWHDMLAIYPQDTQNKDSERQISYDIGSSMNELASSLFF